MFCTQFSMEFQSVKASSNILKIIIPVSLTGQ